MSKFERADASPTFDFYQMMFEGTDIYMSYWQPMLKGAGRLQLELAQLAAKAGQSTLSWATNLAMSRAPADALKANLSYFEALAAHQRDSFEKMTAAIAKAAETPPAFEILKMPVRTDRDRDILVLPVDGDKANNLQRKVA